MGKIEEPAHHQTCDMDLIFYLSGEHETLPKSEVLALLGSAGGVSVLYDLDQILVVKVDEINLSLPERLGMTHSVLGYIGASKADYEEIISLAPCVGRIGGSFAVRVKRIKGDSSMLRTIDLEKGLGDAINGKTADLVNPGTLICGFLTSGGFVLGKTLFEINRSEIEERSPRFRPFFHPSSLSPILSRTLCNLCGVGQGTKVLDPFCGTGGILIEAGLMGAEIFGSDLDDGMVKGCRENLDYYGLRGSISQADAASLSETDKYDAVITDPPYGRGSTTMGRKLEDVYKKAMKPIYRTLKPGGRACVLSPAQIDLEGIGSRSGFKIRESHEVRVHRSLTRKIAVLEKEGCTLL